MSAARHSFLIFKHAVESVLQTLRGLLKGNF